VDVSGGRGEQVDDFADVAPGGGGADLEPGSQPAVGVAVSETRQHERGLPGGVQAPPPGLRHSAVGADEVATWLRLRVDNGIVEG